MALPPPKKPAEVPSYADLSTVELRIYRPTLESARRAATLANLSLDDLVERLLMAHLNTRYALGML